MNLKKNLLLFLELFFLGVAIYLPDALVPLLFSTENLFDNGGAMLIFSAIFTIELGFLLYYLIGIKKEKAKSLGILGFKTTDLSRGLLIFLVIFLFYFMVNLLANFLPKEILEQLTQGHSWSLSQISLAPMVLLFCLFIGFKEELFFRALCIGRLKTWGLPPWAAILMSSLIFSSLHLYEGLLAGFFALGSAIIFGVFYEKWKNVFTLAAAHGLFNFTILMISYYLKDQLI